MKEIIEKINNLPVISKAENKWVNNKYLPITLKLVDVEKVKEIIQSELASLEEQECIHFDEAQGRDKCCNDKVKSNRCIADCGHKEVKGGKEDNIDLSNPDFHLNCTKCGNPYWDIQSFPAFQLCSECKRTKSKQPPQEVKSAELKTVLQWYADKTNREVTEFDDYDLHVCRVAEEYAQTVKMPSEEEIEKQFPTNIQAIKIKEGFDKMSYNGEQSLRLIARHNESKKEGAKWVIDLMKK